MHNVVSSLGDLFSDPDELKTKFSLFSKSMGPALQGLELEARHSTALCTVGLYDVIMLCGMSKPNPKLPTPLIQTKDDSSSMTCGNRSELLAETVLRILPVATRLNKAGVSLRFINSTSDEGFNGLTSSEVVEDTLRISQPWGTTMIGTVLRNKIVNPILARARTNRLLSPVLVVIITDGEVRPRTGVNSSFPSHTVAIAYDV